MNTNVERMIENSLTYLDFQTTQHKDQTMSHSVPEGPWESVRAGIFSTNNNHYLCTKDYQIKFPTIKQVERFSTDNLIKTCKIIFSQYILPS